MDTELFNASEVAAVVRHDGAATSSDGGLQHHVVAWIPENRSPQVEHLLTVRHSTDVVEQVVNVAILNVVQFPCVTFEHIFVLQHERDRDASLEEPGVDH